MIVMCLVEWSLCAASTRSNFFLYVQSIQGSDLTKCLTLSVSYQLTVFNNLKVLCRYDVDLRNKISAVFYRIF